jgi:hypothetical protein
MIENRKPRLIIILLLLASYLPLFAQGSAGSADTALHAAVLNFPGDSAYDSAFSEALRAGILPVSAVYPLFGSELGIDLTDINQNAKPELKSGLSVSFSTPSLYYDSPASQDDLAANLLGSLSLSVTGFPEIQHYLQNLPDPVSLDLWIYPSPRMAFKLDLFFNYRRDSIIGQSSTFQWDLDQWMGNLLGAAEFPSKAYLAWAGDNFGIAAGRFPAGMGWGRLTGATLNPRASWYDQIRLYFDAGKLRFNAMWASSSAQLSEAESEIQFRRKTDGSSFWDSLNDHDFAANDQAIKLATWHQVEWKPLTWLGFGFAEMSMIGGRAPALHFVLPSAIWHSAYAAGYSNVGASIQAAAVPLPGLLVAGELFIDDMRSSDEPTTAKPQALAWTGVARWSKAFSPKLGLDLGLEYGHADRWTYVRWNPYLAMYQRQTLAGGRRSLDQSLGAPWGPDHDSIGAYARLSGAGGSYLELSYEFIRKGPIYQGMGAQIAESVMSEDWSGDDDTFDKIWVPVFYDYDKYAGPGALAAILARPDEYRHLISLLGNYPLGKGLELKLSTTLGFYQNFGNTAGVAKVMILAYIGILYRIPTGAK